jgi:aspartate-semialdehyde dehydrogenase
MKTYRVGVIGATGMVGQRFVSLLDGHPWFQLTALAASSRSAGKSYGEVMEGRWLLKETLPEKARNLPVFDAFSDVKDMVRRCDFVFCAVDLPKEKVVELEELYAKLECPVISNNSALRGQSDVPMLLPECNGDHADIIPAQRRRLGSVRGFVAVKPNCSLQSYVPALHPLRRFGLEQVLVVTCQAISGAGKTFDTWPEMVDNLIPLIPGEEEKSRKEPLKIWGELTEEATIPAEKPEISAQCLRVPVSDGHMATVFVRFREKPTKEQILSCWREYKGLELPSAPREFLHYFEEENRPQTRLDRDFENGMGISIGRLQEDGQYNFRFVCLSHNTLRGAAGGAVLMAEYLAEKGYL